MGEIQELEHPNASFTQENNWMYFLKEKNATEQTLKPRKVSERFQ